MPLSPHGRPGDLPSGRSGKGLNSSLRSVTLQPTASSISLRKKADEARDAKAGQRSLGRWTSKLRGFEVIRSQRRITTGITWLVFRLLANPRGGNAVPALLPKDFSWRSDDNRPLVKAAGVCVGPSHLRDVGASACVRIDAEKRQLQWFSGDRTTPDTLAATVTVPPQCFPIQPAFSVFGVDVKVEIVDVTIEKTKELDAEVESAVNEAMNLPPNEIARRARGGRSLSKDLPFDTRQYTPRMPPPLSPATSSSREDHSSSSLDSSPSIAPRRSRSAPGRDDGKLPPRLALATPRDQSPGNQALYSCRTASSSPRRGHQEHTHRTLGSDDIDCSIAQDMEGMTTPHFPYTPLSEKGHPPKHTQSWRVGGVETPRCRVVELETRLGHADSWAARQKEQLVEARQLEEASSAQLSKLRLEHKAAKEKLRQAEAQNDELAAQLRAARSKGKEARSKLTETECELETAMKRIALMERQLRDTKEATSSVNSQLFVASAREEALLQQIEELKAKALADAVVGSTSEVEDLRNKLKSAEAEAVLLRSQCNEVVSGKQREEKRRLDALKELGLKDVQLSEALSKNAALEKQLADSRARGKEVSAMELRVSELERQLLAAQHALEEEQQKSRSVPSSARSEDDERQRKYLATLRELGMKDAQLAEATAKVSSLQHTIANLQKQRVEESKKHHEELAALSQSKLSVVSSSDGGLPPVAQGEVQALKDEVNTLREENDVLCGCRTALESQVKALQEEVHTLQQQIDAFEAQAGESAELMAVAACAKRTLQQLLSGVVEGTVAEVAERVRVEVLELKAQARETAESRDAAVKRCAELEGELDDMRTTCASFEEEKAGREAAITSLTASIEAMEAMVQEYRKYEDTGDELRGALERENALREEVAKLRSEAHPESRLRELESSIGELEEELAALGDTEADRRKELEGMVEDLRAEIAALPRVEDTAALKKDLAEAADWAATLEKNLAEARAEVSRLEGVVTAHEEELRHKHSDEGALLEARARAMKAEQTLQCLREEMEAWKDRAAEAEEKAKAARGEMEKSVAAERSTGMLELQEAKKQHEAEMKRADEEKECLRREKEHLAECLREKEQRLEGLEGVVADLQKGKRDSEEMVHAASPQDGLATSTRDSYVSCRAGSGKAQGRKGIFGRAWTGGLRLAFDSDRDSDASEAEPSPTEGLRAQLLATQGELGDVRRRSEKLMEALETERRERVKAEEKVKELQAANTVAKAESALRLAELVNELGSDEDEAAAQEDKEELSEEDFRSCSRSEMEPEVMSPPSGYPETENEETPQEATEAEEPPLPATYRSTGSRGSAKDTAEVAVRCWMRLSGSLRDVHDDRIPIYSYDKLRMPGSQLTKADIDVTRRERYLSDAEFVKVFGCTREEFEMLPMWRQERRKKEVYLF